jgi:hypothetical protein
LAGVVIRVRASDCSVKEDCREPGFDPVELRRSVAGGSAFSREWFDKIRFRHALTKRRFVDAMPEYLFIDLLQVGQRELLR